MFRTTSLILFSAVILFAEFSRGNPSIPQNEKYHSLAADDATDRIQLLIDAQAKLVNRLDQLEIQLRGEVAHREALEADLSQKMNEMDTLKNSLQEQAEQIALLEKKAATNIADKRSSVDQKTVAIPTSCADIRMNPGSASGIHLVRETDAYSNKIKTVFCDFSSPLPEIDISLGYIDATREGKAITKSYFFVQRNAEFSDADKVVPFTLERLNIGFNGAPVGDMDTDSGVFTVPISGTYHFSFSGIKDTTTTPLNIYLRVNGFIITRAFAGPSSSASLALHATLLLRAGEKVDLFKEGTGSLLDTAANQYTSFIGFLLEA